MKLINKLLEYPKDVPPNHVYMFTGNQTVMSNGELIMGSGNALAFKNAYPESPKVLGKEVAYSNQHGMLLFNRFFDLDKHKGSFGCMFTKVHPKDPSPIELVVEAIKHLVITAQSNSAYTFHLPYPAIGLGGLTREQLDKHVETLPNNVWVYYV